MPTKPPKPKPTLCIGCQRPSPTAYCSKCAPEPPERYSTFPARADGFSVDTGMKRTRGLRND